MNLAFLVEDLNPSQLSFLLIKACNALSSVDISPIIFYNNLSKTMVEPNFACMNMSMFSYFRGVAVATSLETAKQLLQSNNNCKKYLYLWDLEWLRKNSDYMENLKVLRNKNLTVLSRSATHSKLIQNYANITNVDVIDLEDVKNLCTQTSTTI